MVEKDLESMSKEELIKKLQEKEEKEPEEKEKKRPLMNDWIALGNNYGVSISVWHDNVLLVKRKKESGEWVDTDQRFNLSHTLMEKIFAKIPIWMGLKHFGVIVAEDPDKEE